jgi:hypothetical protein
VLWLTELKETPTYVYWLIEKDLIKDAGKQQGEEE